MNGVKKVIDGILPVTTTQAVYIDGTNRTLQDAIDNGEITGSATVSVNESNLVWDLFMQCGAVKFKRIDLLTGEVEIGVNDSVLFKEGVIRAMIVAMANGTAKNAGSSFGIATTTESYTLQSGESLIYDSSTNSCSVSTSYVTNATKKLLAYNNGGRITGGVFAPYFDRYCHLYKDKEGLIDLEEIGGHQGYFHSMFVYNDKLVTLEVPSMGYCKVYDLSNFDNNKTITYMSQFSLSLKPTNASNEEYEIRMVACDYSDNNQALLMGNSTNNGAESQMEGYIFYDIDTWISSSEQITFDNCGSYTKIEFTDDLLINHAIAKMCWDRSSNNCAWLTTGNAKYIFRILLGKGTNQLENGVYSYISDDKFNGTYKILSYWVNQIYDYGCKDLVMANGGIIYPIKRTDGGFYFQKIYLQSDGNTSIKVERFIYDPIADDGTHAISGSPEGITIYKNKLIMGHASYPKFYIHDLI